MLPGNFQLTIRARGEAFDDGDAELARLLRKVATAIESVGIDFDDAGTILDSNGNTVGTYYLCRADVYCRYCDRVIYRGDDGAWEDYSGAYECADGGHESE